MPPSACDFDLGDILASLWSGVLTAFFLRTRGTPNFGVVVFSCVKRLDSLFAPAQEAADGFTLFDVAFYTTSSELVTTNLPRTIGEPPGLILIK